MSWVILQEKKTCLESLRRWQWHSWGFSLFPRSFWASRLWWKTELRRTRETGHISCRCFAVVVHPRGVEGRGSFTRWVVGVVICTGSLLKGVFLVSSCPRTITVLREWWSSWHQMTSLSPIARWNWNMIQFTHTQTVRAACTFVIDSYGPLGSWEDPYGTQFSGLIWHSLWCGWHPIKPRQE